MNTNDTISHPIDTRTGDWDASVASAAREALSGAAAALTAKKLDAQPYDQVNGAEAAFGLSVRLGPAHRRPGWSTYAVLEVFDPAFPNLGILTALDRRDDDGEPLIGPRNPTFTLPIDNRLVRFVIPAARSALAALDPTGAHRGIVVLRMPGRCTAADTCALPVWMAFVLRSARRSERALIFTDLQRYERVARACAWLLRGKRMHLFPRTAERGLSPMRLPALMAGGPLAEIQFSAATDAGVAVARDYLAAQQQASA
jgi:hypothetical protein